MFTCKNMEHISFKWEHFSWNISWNMSHFPQNPPIFILYSDKVHPNTTPESSWNLGAIFVFPTLLHKIFYLITYKICQFYFPKSLGLSSPHTLAPALLKVLIFNYLDFFNGFLPFLFSSITYHHTLQTDLSKI